MVAILDLKQSAGAMCASSNWVTEIIRIQAQTECTPRQVLTIISDTISRLLCNSMTRTSVEETTTWNVGIDYWFPEWDASRNDYYFRVENEGLAEQCYGLSAGTNFSN